MSKVAFKHFAEKLLEAKIGEWIDVSFAHS